MITAKVDGHGQVMMRLKNIEKAFGEGVPKEMMDAGFELLRLSQKEVPIRTGTLQNSGTVQIVGNNVVVGYHTTYAAKVHEARNMHFRRGRKAKYLEDPLRLNADKLGVKIGQGMKLRFKNA